MFSSYLRYHKTIVISLSIWLSLLAVYNELDDIVSITLIITNIILIAFAQTNHKLQQANQIKSNFLMNMSHDFRTPASGIYNMACSLYKRIDDNAAKQQMRLIVDSSDKLMKALDDILDYSRLDSGQYIADHEVSDIKTIINEVAAILRPKAIAKQITLSVKHKLSGKKLVKKRVLIHRLLLNIISNAIKFTEVGTVMVVSAFEFSAGQRWLTIKVVDTGIGIEEQFHQSIFEPFYRVESPHLFQGGGVGLGLSNAKTMLKTIGGRIRVKSKPGKGSTFTIYLPETLALQRGRKRQQNDENFS